MVTALAYALVAAGPPPQGPFKPLLETTQEEFDLAMATGPSGLFAFSKARGRHCSECGAQALSWCCMMASTFSGCGEEAAS